MAQIALCFFTLPALSAFYQLRRQIAFFVPKLSLQGLRELKPSSPGSWVCGNPQQRRKPRKMHLYPKDLSLVGVCFLSSVFPPWQSEELFTVGGCHCNVPVWLCLAAASGCIRRVKLSVFKSSSIAQHSVMKTL